MRRNTNPVNPDVKGTYVLHATEIASDGRFLAWERLSLLFGALGLTLLLGVAWYLSPSPEGHGTHRQLGLPDCSMLSMFGIRCPGCGMTTSWSHCMQGNLEGALRSNVGGTMLCLLSLASIPVLIWLGLSGRPSRGGWFSVASIAGFCIAMGVAVIEWLIRLAADR